MKNSLHSFSMVVPDVAAAAHVFRTVFGAEQLPATAEQQTAADMGVAVVDDHGVPARSALLRLDPQTRLRLFSYDATSATSYDASVVDIGTPHFCFRVGDIEQAARFLPHCANIRIMGDVTEIPEGPLRHHKWVYFRLPWGAYGELQEWPASPSAEAKSLFHDQVPQESSPVPTLMGLDHVGFSVRDLDGAVDPLTRCFDGQYVLGSVTESDEGFMRRQFETAVSARSKMAMVRVGEHTNIELFEHIVDGRREQGDRLAIGTSRMTFASGDLAGTEAELAQRFGFSRTAEGDAALPGNKALFTSGSGLDVELLG